MSKKAQLVIESECNVKFNGLEPSTRKKMVEATKFFLPYAKHSPSYKLGRWNGTISYASIGGRTYYSLLDKVLPIVIGDGYELDIIDHRKEYSFDFPTITSTYLVENLENPVWPKGHKNEGEPILLMDHQVDMINGFLENTASIFEISTGAGKCLGYNTKIDIKIENEDFKEFLEE